MRIFLFSLLFFMETFHLLGADNGLNAQEKADEASKNPLLVRSVLQYQAPDFRLIKDEHFLPAFEEAIRINMAEVRAIADNPDPATFENTLVALEKSGQDLTRVSRIFFNLVATDSNPERLNIESTMSPKLAAHSDNITLDQKLFARIKQLYDGREKSGLDAESIRLIELFYERFVRAGAELNEEQKAAIRALNEEHSRLTNKFSQNLLAETRKIAVVVDRREELEGLSESEISTAQLEAKKRGLEGKYLLKITNTTRQPVLSSLHNRSLRQKIWEASAYRAQTGETDNRPLIARIVQLRAKRARLLGQKDFAHYVLQPQMAQAPKAVLEMLGGMLPAVLANTEREADAIRKMIRQKGGDFELQPWDWEYYAEFVRQAQYKIDENEVKEYFELNRVLKDGLFHTMNRLYGIRFEKRKDLPVYHEDVEVYEVFDAEGKSLALFYADYFIRDGKRGGAWMSSFVTQSSLLDQKPVVINAMNIPKAPSGSPTLISYDHATTMFHEMGHALHGMFSNVKYPSLAGTSVSRDFVEFPSTFHEDWAIDPQIVKNYARHYQTEKPIPDELLSKLIESRKFNQGFDTLEYVAAALLDLEWHSLGADEPLQEVNAFEAAALKKYGLVVPAVPPRYKSSYFLHSMGGGYAANYYSYIWSEILAADAFACMMAKGGPTRENGDLFRKHILSVGNSRRLMDSYKAFRGKEPTTDALFARRGLKVK